jgi:hypothetical protein
VREHGAGVFVWPVIHAEHDDGAHLRPQDTRIGAALLGVRHPVHAAMGTGIEPFTQTRGCLGNGVGPGDAAGVEAEVMRARAQPVKKGAVQKSRSA